MDENEDVITPTDPGIPATGNSEETPSIPDGTPSEPAKVPVKRIQYYVLRTRKKVLTEEEALSRRIAEYKHEQNPDEPIPDPIEEQEAFTLRSMDEEANCLIQLDEDIFEEAELPEEGLELMKRISTQEELYSYETDGDTGDITETISVYDTVIQYYYTFYTDEKDKPEPRVSGICAECSHCVLGKFPFSRFLCDQHKYIDKVSGLEFALPCRDFNEFGECELWEEIPEEDSDDTGTDSGDTSDIIDPDDIGGGDTDIDREDSEEGQEGEEVNG